MADYDSTCRRITGWTTDPGRVKRERGPRGLGDKQEHQRNIPGSVGRPEGRMADAYDVLCAAPARYAVRTPTIGWGFYCCARCLSAVVEQFGVVEVTVERINRG